MKFAIALMGILAVLLLVAAFFALESSPQTAMFMPTRADVTVDFSHLTGTQIMQYGANENDNWEAFAYDLEPKTLHLQAGSSYIRVFISDPPWRASTVPYGEDFRQLDAFINGVLDAHAIPFLVIAHDARPAEHTFGELPPNSPDAFVNYAATIVAHYAMACNNNELSRPCDVNEWYLEVWNEPYADAWWPDTYLELFNEVYPAIKAIAPGMKVGGPSLAYTTTKEKSRVHAFIANTPADFVSLHHYGNTLHHTAEPLQLFSAIDVLYGDAWKSLKEHANRPIELINSEYSMNYRTNNVDMLDEPLAATWYAAALIRQIQSQAVSMEIYYSGTSFKDEGFGMWAKTSDHSYVSWPVHTMKSSFVKAHPYGSFLVKAESSTPSVKVLATMHGSEKDVTLVNTLGHAIETNVLIDHELHALHLDPYEVLFIEVK